MLQRGMSIIPMTFQSGWSNFMNFRGIGLIATHHFAVIAEHVSGVIDTPCMLESGTDFFINLSSTKRTAIVLLCHGLMAIRTRSHVTTGQQQNRGHISEAIFAFCVISQFSKSLNLKVEMENFLRLTCIFLSFLAKSEKARTSVRVPTSGLTVVYYFCLQEAPDEHFDQPILALCAWE